TPPSSVTGPPFACSASSRPHAWHTASRPEPNYANFRTPRGRRSIRRPHAENIDPKDTMTINTDTSRLDITFRSGGVDCAAWLYLPASRGPFATIVMGHGLGGIRRMRLDAFAERFQAAGYACLVFDYRHFGASGGEPRQLLDINRQLEDWAAAIGFARTLEGVDPERVVLWGTSFGGGHVIVAGARDERVAAVIAQCPFTDGPASVLAAHPLSLIKATAL